MTHHVFAPDEIELAHGRPFAPSRPDHRMLTLEQMAYTLAGVNRYGAASRPRISVAEHSVFVSEKLGRLGAPLSLQLAGLHHDDAEAINGLGDPQRPAKGLLDEGFRERERKLDHCVWRAFAWPNRNRLPLWTTDQLQDPLLKRVDSWVCAFEAHHAMPSRGVGWEQTFGDDDGSQHPIPDHGDDRMRFWTAEEAEEAFVRQHQWLSGLSLGRAVAA